MGGYRDWRNPTTSIAARQRGGGKVLSFPSGALRADRDRVDREFALVPTGGGRVGLRAADRRPRQDSGGDDAETKDRQAGCRAHVATAAGGSFSRDMGSAFGRR